MFESIPQAFVWGFLVLIALLVAWGGGAIRPYASTTAPRPWTAQTGLLAPWARLIFQSTSDDYARWRLAQRLAQLTQNAIGMGSTTELRRYLASDPANVPADVRAYLLAGLSNYTPQRRSFLALLDPSERRNSPLALDPERVITFLEAQSGAAQT